LSLASYKPPAQGRDSTVRNSPFVLRRSAPASKLAEIRRMRINAAIELRHSTECTGFRTKRLQSHWLHVALCKPVGSALADAVRCRGMSFTHVRFLPRDTARRRATVLRDNPMSRHRACVCSHEKTTLLYNIARRQRFCRLSNYVARSYGFALALPA
jgi:hypothetical protein